MTLKALVCRVIGHTRAMRYLDKRSTLVQCLRCDALRDEGPWCPEFVPWSCWGVIDPSMDSCDVCGCPRASHPVLTWQDEDDHRALAQRHEITLKVPR